MTTIVPPPEYAHLAEHRLLHAKGGYVLAEWRDKKWRLAGTLKWKGPEAIWNTGYNYLCPMVHLYPNDPALVERVARKWLMEPTYDLNENFPLNMRFETLDQFSNCIKAVITELTKERGT